MDEHKFGLYIFLGAAIGGGVGTALVAASGNVINGAWLGHSLGRLLAGSSPQLLMKKRRNRILRKI